MNTESTSHPALVESFDDAAKSAPIKETTVIIKSFEPPRPCRFFAMTGQDRAILEDLNVKESTASDGSTKTTVTRALFRERTIALTWRNSKGDLIGKGMPIDEAALRIAKYPTAVIDEMFEAASTVSATNKEGQDALKNGSAGANGTEPSPTSPSTRSDVSLVSS